MILVNFIGSPMAGKIITLLVLMWKFLHLIENDLPATPLSAQLMGTGVPILVLGDGVWVSQSW